MVNDVVSDLLCATFQLKQWVDGRNPEELPPEAAGEFAGLCAAVEASAGAAIVAVAAQSDRPELLEVQAWD